MTEYRVEVRVKNGLLYNKIMGAGYSSISEFCRKFGFDAGALGAIINFRKLPVGVNGDWLDLVWNISSALHCEPEELFTETQKKLIAKKTVSVTSINEETFLLSADSHHKEIENREMVKLLQTSLTPREERVIKARIYQNQDLQEIGEEMNISGTRVRQIEQKAFRKMRCRVAALNKKQRDIEAGKA